MGVSPMVFAEPGSPLASRPKAMYHWFEARRRLGVWGNWVQAAKRLAAITKCDAVLLLQDDVCMHPESLRLAEALFERYPSDHILSLYTPPLHALDAPGVKVAEAPQLGGACALAFRKDHLERILRSSIIESWRGSCDDSAYLESVRQDPAKIANSDAAIGKIVTEYGWKFVWPTPSCTEHTAHFSTIPGHGSNEVERNRNAVSIADFERPLLQQVWPNGL